MSFGTLVGNHMQYPSGTISFSPTAGNLLVAFISGNGDCGSVSVSGGGTWVSLPNINNGASGDELVSGRLFYCLSATGGASTFTLNGPPADAGWGIKEFTGATTWTLDKNSQGYSNNNTSTISSGLINISYANELLVAFWADEVSSSGQPTWSSSWINSSDTDDNANHYDSFIDGTVSATGSYSADGTEPAFVWVCGIASFYAASGSSGINWVQEAVWWERTAYN